jgi:hypothetical protein
MNLVPGSSTSHPLLHELARNLRLFFGESANRFNRTAGGKSEVGGIVDNKYFRLIRERSLERSPSRLPPKGGGDRAVAAPGAPVGAQDAEKCLHLLTP